MVSLLPELLSIPCGGAGPGNMTALQLKCHLCAGLLPQQSGFAHRVPSSSSRNSIAGGLLRRAFGPAWTVLYIMMGVASWQVTQSLSAPWMRFNYCSCQSQRQLRLWSPFSLTQCSLRGRSGRRGVDGCR